MLVLFLYTMMFGNILELQEHSSILINFNKSYTGEHKNVK